MLIEGKDYKFENDILSIYDKEKWATISIDGYNQEEIIAAGANGITILAYHEILNRRVVIKVWKPRTDDLAQYEEQFKGEIRKIASIASPYIAIIHEGKILDNGYCYAVMEYIKGITFKKWSDSYYSIHNLAEKPVIKNLITALLSYQQYGIVHGDIHGGNILISNDRNVHIIDFGTSYPDKKAQSLSRELYLEFTTLISVLEKEQFYNPDHFIIHTNDRKKKLVVDEKYRSIINLNPMLLTETLMSYAIILGAVETNRFNNLECIKALAFAIANSSYLNLAKIVIDILKMDIIDKDYFFRTLIPHLQTAVYSDYQEGLSTFYCDDMLGVLSLQAYLEWYRSPDFSVTIDFEDDEIGRLFKSYSADEIRRIIDNNDLDAVDIFANDRSHFSIIRGMLMMSIEKEYFKKDFTHCYYLKTTIKEKLLNKSILDKLQLYKPTTDYNSIISFFDTIHTELYDAYDALV